MTNSLKELVLWLHENRSLATLLVVATFALDFAVLFAAVIVGALSRRAGFVLMTCFAILMSFVVGSILVAYVWHVVIGLALPSRSLSRVVELLLCLCVPWLLLYATKRSIKMTPR